MCTNMKAQLWEKKQIRHTPSLTHNCAHMYVRRQFCAQLCTMLPHIRTYVAYACAQICKIVTNKHASHATNEIVHESTIVCVHSCTIIAHIAHACVQMCTHVCTAVYKMSQPAPMPAPNTYVLVHIMAHMLRKWGREKRQMGRCG